MPTEPNKRYCPDAIDTSTNKSRFPALKAAQPRDYCLIRKGRDAPRVGRVFSPPYSNYSSKQKEIQQRERALGDHVLSFMENLSRASERLQLYAKGARALEAKNPSLADEYIRRVRAKFGLDLRSIASASSPPEVSKQTLHEISQITPPAVIKRANELVTKSVRDELEERVRANQRRRRIYCTPARTMACQTPDWMVDPLTSRAFPKFESYGVAERPAFCGRKSQHCNGSESWNRSSRLVCVRASAVSQEGLVSSTRSASRASAPLDRRGVGRALSNRHAQRRTAARRKRPIRANTIRPVTDVAPPIGTSDPVKN
jgi:hypothetical protein